MNCVVCNQNQFDQIDGYYTCLNCGTAIGGMGGLEQEFEYEEHLIARRQDVHHLDTRARRIAERELAEQATGYINDRRKRDWMRFSKLALKSFQSCLLIQSHDLQSNYDVPETLSNTVKRLWRSILSIWRKRGWGSNSSNSVVIILSDPSLNTQAQNSLLPYIAERVGEDVPNIGSLVRPGAISMPLSLIIQYIALQLLRFPITLQELLDAAVHDLFAYKNVMSKFEDHLHNRIKEVKDIQIMYSANKIFSLPVYERVFTQCTDLLSNELDLKKRLISSNSLASLFILKHISQLKYDKLVYSFSVRLLSLISDKTLCSIGSYKVAAALIIISYSMLHQIDTHSKPLIDIDLSSSITASEHTLLYSYRNNLLDIRKKRPNFYSVLHSIAESFLITDNVMFEAFRSIQKSLLFRLIPKRKHSLLSN